MCYLQILSYIMCTPLSKCLLLLQINHFYLNKNYFCTIFILKKFSASSKYKTLNYRAFRVTAANFLFQDLKALINAKKSWWIFQNMKNLLIISIFIHEKQWRNNLIPFHHKLGWVLFQVNIKIGIIDWNSQVKLGKVWQKFWS